MRFVFCTPRATHACDIFDEFAQRRRWIDAPSRVNGLFLVHFEPREVSLPKYRGWVPGSHWVQIFTVVNRLREPICAMRDRRLFLTAISESARFQLATPPPPGNWNQNGKEPPREAGYINKPAVGRIVRTRV